MSHNENDKFNQVNQEPIQTPSDIQVIKALRLELIRTQRAYLIEHSKNIAMQMDMLNIEESNLTVNDDEEMINKP